MTRAKKKLYDGSNQKKKNVEKRKDVWNADGGQFALEGNVRGLNGTIFFVYNDFLH